MIHRNRQQSAARSAGFTLIEVLVASAISATLIVALYAVFHGAINLRESTHERLGEVLPRSYAAQTFRRDFGAMMPPAGILAGPLLGERDEEDAQRSDSLEFYTASAVVGGEQPWGDIQKVEYRLAENDSPGTGQGSDFVRVVTRNLLASTIEEAPEQRLLSGVKSLEFSYYDGETWEESWDSIVRENAAPRAVRIRIEFASDESEARSQKPMESVYEVIQVAQDLGGEAPGGASGGQAAAGQAVAVPLAVESSGEGRTN